MKDHYYNITQTLERLRRLLVNNSETIQLLEKVFKLPEVQESALSSENQDALEAYSRTLTTILNVARGSIFFLSLDVFVKNMELADLGKKEQSEFLFLMREAIQKNRYLSNSTELLDEFAKLQKEFPTPQLAEVLIFRKNRNYFFETPSEDNKNLEKEKEVYFKALNI